MKMKLREIFSKSPGFVFKNHIVYQQGLPQNSAFEKTYISVRDQERRVYADEVVSSLPDVDTGHPHKKDWDMRKSVLQELISYLRQSAFAKDPVILEIGCGNGWLCAHLASILKSEVLGIDINEAELKQAARVFAGHQNICFAYADIFTADLPPRFFDYIILPASIQYFSDLQKLLNRLFTLLSDQGEIHILDSPLYHDRDVSAAQKRSREYFSSMGSDLGRFYHHHTWNSLTGFDATILFNPRSVRSRIRKLFRPASPFPWLRITNGSP